MDIEFATSLRVLVDTHTLNRLEALKVLLREQDPLAPFDRDQAIREALLLGLDLLVGEALQRERRTNLPLPSLTRIAELHEGH